MPQEPDFYDSLDLSLAQSWACLEDGVINRRSGFHTLVAATIGVDGAPRARTVVLREADRAGRIIRFHTDRRSPKFQELKHDPRISLHGYDAKQKVQLRVRGIASLHEEDAIADAAWASSRSFSRVCYGVQPGSGAAIDEGGDYLLPSTDETIEAGRSHFSAVVIAVKSLEWLYLSHSGHRRALFDLTDPSNIKQTWLTP